MSSLEQFNVNIGKIAEGIDRNSSQSLRQAALAIDTAVVTATPVDTGRARSNWLVDINKPANGIREPYAPGDKLGTSESANLSAALEHAAIQIGTAKADSEIHITNNLPYISELNNGSSKQAPKNFVGLAVQAATTAIRNKKLVTR